MDKFLGTVLLFLFIVWLVWILDRLERQGKIDLSKYWFK